MAGKGHSHNQNCSPGPGERYDGDALDSNNEEGISVFDGHGRVTFFAREDFIKKILIAVEYKQELHENKEVFVVNIPRDSHHEPACMASKEKELKDFDHFNMYDTVDKPVNVNIIGMEWVLVEKDKSDSSKVIKARLCMRGTQRPTATSST